MHQMEDNITIDELCVSIEPALSFVSELCGNDTAGSQQAIWEALAACVMAFDIFRPPNYETYEPARRFREAYRSLKAPCSVASEQPCDSCVGDPGQIMTVFRALGNGAELDTDSGLMLELTQETDTGGGVVPKYLLTLDGPGRFPEPVPLGYGIEIPMERLCACWTRATRGGRIDKAPNGWACRLRGQRMITDAATGLDVMLEKLNKAERSARILASGEALSGKEQTTLSHAINEALALTDGEYPAEAGSLEPVMKMVMRGEQPRLDEHAIAVETACCSIIPPIMLRRKPIRAFWRSLCCHAHDVLFRGGALSVLLDYSDLGRHVQVTAEITGTQCDTGETVYVSSMRRSADVHGGSFHMKASQQGVLFEAAFPDIVGATLDTWIPGWDRFSERSRQMLRLLKSAGQENLRDAILAGVLEDELEAILLPRIRGAAAINMAHELTPDTVGLDGASSERLNKALVQIRRGQPKRELAKLPHVAGLIWAYRISQRHREAIGLGKLDQEQLERLCHMLQREQHEDCLRIVAQTL